MFPCFQPPVKTFNISLIIIYCYQVCPNFNTNFSGFEPFIFKFKTLVDFENVPVFFSEVFASRSFAFIYSGTNQLREWRLNVFCSSMTDL